VSYSDEALGDMGKEVVVVNTQRSRNWAAGAYERFHNVTEKSATLKQLVFLPGICFIGFIFFR